FCQTPMLLEVQWLDMSRPNRLSASQQPILLLQPTQALILLIQIEKQQAKEARWKKKSQDPYRKSKRVDKNLPEAEILVPVKMIRRFHNIIKPL
ncbi:MAG TPA: hypothetical protein VJ225_01470, partial [Nitrososphaeraceae archaeon]|nr:hypothetical protein [Nitrososphaeraceae archaeon]